MDHFNIVLAIARAALKTPNKAVIQHLKRLRKALMAEGVQDQASAVLKLLDSGETSGQLKPSRVVLAEASIAGEMMTPSVKPPIDKETAAELCEITRVDALDQEEEIVLDDELRPAVDALVSEWRQTERLQALNVRPPLNCLLYGVPGTGKTRMAHYVASQLGLPLVTARLDGLISSFLGTTARNIATLFDFANRYQCVLLLDEFDAVAKIRDDPHEVGEIKRVVNTLLQCLDERSNRGFTIAITNHEQLLDTAVWRRFDVRIHLPKPDFHSRIAIVERFGSALDLSMSQKRLLAWLTTDRSGAEIEKLCNGLLRLQILSEDQDMSITEALRLNAKLNANFNDSPQQQAMLCSEDALARELAAQPDGLFSQFDLADLFGKDQSTISRWLNKPMEVA